MKKKISRFFVGIIVFQLLLGVLSAQTVTLTFTGKQQNNHYVQLNRVVITNLTKNWQETVLWPDTVLTMQEGTGIDEYIENTSFALSQNNPNPFRGTTNITLTVAEHGTISIHITDVSGHTIVEPRNYASLQPGVHHFCISLSTIGSYIMTARQNGKISSIKMICNEGRGTNHIDYIGTTPNITYVLKSTTNNPFNVGDQMEYVGYATINGDEIESQHITQAQDSSQYIALVFPNAQPQDGEPCPVAPTVTDYDGNVYNTVQIGNQCWMKENLRTTHYADGTSIALGSTANNTVVYRYYPNNDSSNVSTYGYLYNWVAVMHEHTSSSTNPSGVQGICPIGWHVPSDAEWTQLTDYVSTQSQYVCGNGSSRIAKSLSSTTGWNSSTNTCAVGNTPDNNNATGFSAFPAGCYYYNNICAYFNYGAYFWSSTQGICDGAYRRILYFCDVDVTSGNYDKREGYSVRCIRDTLGVITSAATNITSFSATLNGCITNPDNVTITEMGFEWKTLNNDTYTQVIVTGDILTYDLIGLSINTSYTYRAYINTPNGNFYGEDVIFTTFEDAQPCPNAPTVTDYDGNVYNTVQIGNQCWMKENLRTTHYANGAYIELGGENEFIALRYYPNDDSSNVNTYGYLYNWKAAMRNSSSSSAIPSGVQGICPNEWHMPSDIEWTQLTNYVSSQNQYVCGSDSANIAKALASTTGWWVSGYEETCAVANNQNSNNATGFSALPAGNSFNGAYAFHYGAYFWSSTENSDIAALIRWLGTGYVNVHRNNYNKSYGLSVRCIHD